MVIKAKIHAKYCPECDGNSTVKRIGATLVHFTCDTCGKGWSRHTSDLYLIPKSNEIRLDPEKFIARTVGAKRARTIGQFGGNKTQLLREHIIDGKRYQMWGFDTKSRSSANHYADQLRRTGKEVVVQESKTPDSAHGWMIFARTRPGRKLGSKIGSFGEKGQNGYICLHKGKKYEIYAESTFEAQKKCAQQNNIKKAYEISVHLAEKNGKPVTHVADF